MFTGELSKKTATKRKSYGARRCLFDLSSGLSDFIEDSSATRRGHQLELVRFGAAVKQ
jgi:hypothetical protein